MAIAEASDDSDCSRWLLGGLHFNCLGAVDARGEAPSGDDFNARRVAATTSSKLYTTVARVPISVAAGSPCVPSLPSRD